MATVTNVSSNYAGKEAGAIIGKTFKEADTLRLGVVTLAPNVGYTLNLRRVRYTDGTTAYSCGYDPQGAITLNERVLSPVKLKMIFKFVKKILERHGHKKLWEQVLQIQMHQLTSWKLSKWKC